MIRHFENVLESWSCCPLVVFSNKVRHVDAELPNERRNIWLNVKYVEKSLA
jgi:hypothetical protein